MKLFLFTVFFAATTVQAKLVTPPGRDGTLSFKARSYAFDGSVTYREPYLNGPAQVFPLAAQGETPKDIDYDRICVLLGNHTASVHVEPVTLESDDELFWIETLAMFPKLHDQVILFITCQ